jgi:hypothetical protein
MWALIINGVVVELTDTDPKGRFHPSLDWVECESSVVEGSTYDGSTFSAPKPTSLEGIL